MSNPARVVGCLTIAICGFFLGLGGRDTFPELFEIFGLREPAMFVLDPATWTGLFIHTNPKA